MITINMEMDGLLNTATVTEIVNRHHNMFMVEFEDGYENIFYTDVESGKWVEEDLGFTLLAQEFGRQIKIICVIRFMFLKSLPGTSNMFMAN